LLTDLPIGAIERAMVHDPKDQILALAIDRSVVEN